MSRSYISKKIKSLVRTRANHCCEYCQYLENYSPQSFSMEHIIPLHDGGENTLSNLALSCQGCNNHKHIKTSVLDEVSQKIVPLFHPRNDTWKEHFRWNENFSEIEAITDIGRVSIKTLKLNRSNLINFRIALFLTGEHPPLHTL